MTLLSLNYDLSKPLEEKCLLFWEFILHLLIWGKIEYFKQCSIAAVARKGEQPQRLPGDKAIRKLQSPCLTSLLPPSLFHSLALFLSFEQRYQNQFVVV